MKKDQNIVQINIGKETIVSVVITLCAMYLVFIILRQIFDVLLLLFVAYIISVGLKPSIDKLINKNVNKSLSIMLVYLDFGICDCSYIFYSFSCKISDRCICR